jgi:type IV pilus assembly protein PilF
MKYKNIIILLAFVTVIVSCTSNGPRKSTYNNRKANVNQVADDSPEMIYLELGVGYLKRGKEGDVDIALGNFKKSIGFNPKFAQAHSMLANVYDRKGLFDSAEKHYKLSIKYNNGSPDIINNYANFLCQRGFYDLAIEKYQQVVNNPEYKSVASAYENDGVCATRGKNVQQAEVFFRKALEINSKQPNSLYNLMLIHLNQKQYMKALPFLQRLEQVVQPSAEMLSAGYKIEKGLNHEDLAAIYLITLKKNFPNSESYKNIQ